MPEIIVENITKKFKLSGNDKNATLRDQIIKLAKHPLAAFIEDSKKDFLALDDISFIVNKGDVIGLIGKNGSGKSTLLKIISRVTSPTEGKIIIKGKVVSILEVGTGFHPELTGKENIFLNSSINKMSKREINKKFNEIVKFSGIGKFLNSPVKFYSSGMYMRLAFAIAAHIDSDILLIDEVLSVGDYEFQKKCLTKINNLTKDENRTIILVSHNMEAIQSICSKVIWLNKGKIIKIGDTKEVVNEYIDSCLETKNDINYDEKNAPGNELLKIKRLCVIARNDQSRFFTINTPLEIRCEFWSFKDFSNFNISLILYNIEQIVFNSVSPVTFLPQGLNRFSCLVPGSLLNDGIYYVKILLVDNSAVVYELEDMCRFNLIDEREHKWYGKWSGVVRPKLEWKMENKIANQ